FNTKSGTLIRFDSCVGNQNRGLSPGFLLTPTPRRNLNRAVPCLIERASASAFRGQSDRFCQSQRSLGDRFESHGLAKILASLTAKWYTARRQAGIATFWLTRHEMHSPRLAGSA